MYKVYRTVRKYRLTSNCSCSHLSAKLHHQGGAWLQEIKLRPPLALTIADPIYRFFTESSCRVRGIPMPVDSSRAPNRKVLSGGRYDVSSLKNHWKTRFGVFLLDQLVQQPRKHVWVIGRKVCTLSILNSLGYSGTWPHPTCIGGAQMTTIPLTSRWTNWHFPSTR